MPEDTSIKKFLRSVKTRKTDTTKVLDAIFSDPVSLKNLNYHGQLLAEPIYNASLPPWAKTLIQSKLGALTQPAGIEPPDPNKVVAHIERWETSQRQAMQNAFVYAIQNGHIIQFFWELHYGTNEEIIISPDPAVDALGQGDVITVTFRSPWKNVREEASTGQVYVGVGKVGDPKE